MNRILIFPETTSAREIEERLGALLPPQGFDLRLVTSDDDSFRTLEPTLLLTLAGSGGAVLGALITGLLQVARQVKARTIILQGKSGRRIEVPADCSPSEIQEYVRLARELDVERIAL